ARDQAREERRLLPDSGVPGDHRPRHLGPGEMVEAPAAGTLERRQARAVMPRGAITAWLGECSLLPGGSGEGASRPPSFRAAASKGREVKCWTRRENAFCCSAWSS